MLLFGIPLLQLVALFQLLLIPSHVVTGAVKLMARLLDDAVADVIHVALEVS
jgi:Na+/glutamate symporter